MDSKKELAEWALNQFAKYGVKQPDTYTAEELKYLNPGVPVDFIDRHVAAGRVDPGADYIAIAVAKRNRK